MLRSVSLVLFASLFVSLAQAQPAGAGDHALGGSSVMWLPRGGSLFLNPAELARIRQGDFFFTSNRLQNLSSFSASYFFPFVGTFATGVATYGPATQYSLGYARSIGSTHSFGVAISGFRNTQETFGFSLGGSLHFPASTETSGLHTAASLMNLSDQSDSRFLTAHLGIGYWILPDHLRLQASYRHSPGMNDALIGSELLLSRAVSVRAGTRTFKEIFGGLALAISRGSIELSAGKTGVSITFNALLTDPAPVQRSTYFELGQAALEEERYYEASVEFRTAYEYDRTFEEARIAAERSDSLLAAMMEPALAEAKKYHDSKRYLEAAKAYSRILKMRSGHPEAEKQLQELQPRMRGYYNRLIAEGDSLRGRKEIERARRNYQLALELEPENDSLLARIADLNSAVQTTVRSVLSRANDLLNRNRLDDAQREFERALALEPRNTRALQGLETIRKKRTQETLKRGISAFQSSEYMTALRIFLQVTEQDPRNREATEYLALIRTALKSEVETLFRSGLQYYAKDNFKAAIQEWDKVLQIDPNHAGTLEYRKRAEEKVQALEKLK